MSTGGRGRQGQDRIVIAWLVGAASHHASGMAGGRPHWGRPEGADRERAVAELVETATEMVATGLGPRGRLRADLLGQAAGACRAVAERGGLDGPLNAIMADLLVDAGADPGVTEAWRAATLERLVGRTGYGEPGFARPFGQ